MQNYLSLILLLLLFNGCSNLGEYNYQPQENVNVKVVLKELSYESITDSNWTSLYFDYIVINKSKNQIYFRFDSLTIQFNEFISSKIYYNSIATIIPEKIQIANGEKNLSLYAVFPDSVKVKTQNDFRIISYGFVK